MPDAADILRLEDCPQCGYDLRGLSDGYACPECGFEYAADTCCFRADRRADKTIMVLFSIVAGLELIQLLMVASRRGLGHETLFHLAIAICFAGMAGVAFWRARYGRPGSALVQQVIFDAKGFRLLGGRRVARDVRWHPRHLLTMTPCGRFDRIWITRADRRWISKYVLCCEVEMTPRQAAVLLSRIKGWIENATYA